MIINHNPLLIYHFLETAFQYRFQKSLTIVMQHIGPPPQRKANKETQPIIQSKHHIKAFT